MDQNLSLPDYVNFARLQKSSRDLMVYSPQMGCPVVIAWSVCFALTCTDSQLIVRFRPRSPRGEKVLPSDIGPFLRESKEKWHCFCSAILGTPVVCGTLSMGSAFHTLVCGSQNTDCGFYSELVYIPVRTI
jgi:hypothetical protein